jgi:aspartate/glutamate racemase
MDFMRMLPPVKQMIDSVVDRLSPHDQEKVLIFARALTLPRGISGEELAKFFAQYSLTDEEKQQMQQIMEELKTDD